MTATWTSLLSSWANKALSVTRLGQFLGSSGNMQMLRAIRHIESESLTIATGAVIASGDKGRLVIDTQGSAAYDDLDTISGLADGDIVRVQCANNARAVNLRNGTGNLVLPYDILLDNTLMWVDLAKIGSTNLYLVNAYSTAAPGSCMDWAGATAPMGWMLRDGTAILRLKYTALFTVCSTTFGAGDSSTTFNLPDDRGRTNIGSGSGSGLTTRARGATGGEENHQLTVAELASHQHNHVVTVGNVANTGTAVAAGSQAGATAYAGSDTAHNNMQPWLALPKIIKY